MNIIAFTGKKGTGKSTACAYVEEKYNYKRVNFKDALLSELKNNFPDLLAVLAGKYNMTVDELFQVKPQEVRTLMQNYGTNVRRKDDPDYWTSKWENRYRSLATHLKTTFITVDDARFLNEAQAVKDNGGIIIRLTRADMTHTDSHISELEMDSITPDFTIECVGGDHQFLYNELDKIVTNLL